MAVAEIFGPDLLVLVILGLLTLVISVWAIIDIVRSPMSGGRKLTWTLGIAFGWYLFVLPGTLLAVTYLARVRRRVTPDLAE